MRKRFFMTVAVIGCVGLALALWFLFKVGPSGGTLSVGGGTASLGVTSVQYVRVLPEGGLSLVIWTDLNERVGQSTRSSWFAASSSGFFAAAGGRRIDWVWQWPKEKGGEVQIDGKAYDLANGKLFLVAAKGERVQITQLDVDLSDVKPDQAGFEAFAKTQPEVARFVADAAARK